MQQSHSQPPQPLFLADEDDEDVSNARSPQYNPPPTIDIDIDAIFADVEPDDQDDLFTFKPLAPALDTDALRREAELRHKNSAPPLTPHAILPSSSPPRDTGPDQTTKYNQGGTEAGKEGKKERKRPVRLNEARLLGPTGFPQLIKNTENFRTKGKGHEATDLKRLLQVYQFWTHEMYPPDQFRDTVDRVEKLCHSKRMNVALSVWRDEAHGVVRGKKVEDETLELSDEENEQNVKDEAQTLRPSSGSTPADYASSSSPPSRPPSSGTEIDDDDDFDIDAVIREEVERNEKARAAAGQDQGQDQYHIVAKGKGKMVAADEDDGALWNGIDARSAESSTAQAANVDSDMAMWDAVDALEEDTSAPAKPPISSSVDGDEDMWDIVQELENAPAVVTAPISVPTASTENVTVAAAPPPPQDDDDWEDMYV